MWIAIILTLLNTFLPESYVIESRVTIWGAPITPFDVALAAGLVLILITGRGRMAQFPADTHRLVLWIAGLYLGFLVIGAVVGVASNIPSKWLLPRIRDYAAVPISMLIGYFCIATPRSAQRWMSVQFFAGICTAVLILIFFATRAGAMKSGDRLDQIRALDYVPGYAGLAFLMLMYATVTGLNRWPKLVVIPVAGLCLVGQFATLNRSDWVAVAVTVLWLFRLLPGRLRLRGLALCAIIVPVMGGMLLGAISFASALSGKNVSDTIVTRLSTLLPTGEESNSQNRRAWETRLSGIEAELNLFLSNPLFGRGLGIQRLETNKQSGGATEISYFHNDWTSIMAEGGVIGLSTRCALLFGMMVIGRRMVSDRLDRGSMLIGALGSLTGFYFLLLGSMTGGINNYRGGIVIGVVCGVMLRARAMQRAVAQQWAGYLDPAGSDGTAEPLLGGDGRGAFADPAFGTL